MEHQNEIAVYRDDEIDLREIFSVLFAAKKMILSVIVIFAVVSLLIALNTPNKYKAFALLAPAQQQTGGLSGALGDLGGLAALAGVNLGGGDNSEAAAALEIIKSRGFLERFIQENQMAVEIFAAEDWDEENNRLVIDNSLYDEVGSRWQRASMHGESLQPSNWELYEKFSDIMTISQDKKTGMVTISVEHFSPIVAKQWVDKLVSAINFHMQQRKLQMVNTNIKYLEGQVIKTNIAEMREVFYTIIQEQIKAKMLAEASPEYAFITISPAMVPEEKSKPQRALILMLGTLLGAMLSIVFALARYYVFSGSINRN